MTIRSMILASAAVAAIAIAPSEPLFAQGSNSTPGVSSGQNGSSAQARSSAGATAKGSSTNEHATGRAENSEGTRSGKIAAGA